MADKVTIHNGTITADTVNVDVQLNANAVSVSGDVTIEGNLSVAGKNVFEDIAEQKALLENHASLIGMSDSPHLSESEHTQLTQVIQLFETYDTATNIPVADAPQEAISLEYFPTLFKNRAMANWDLPTAPGHVFVSRVPYAISQDGSYKYTAATMEASGNAYDEYGSLPSKLLNNILPNGNPRQHTCSTDTVEGVDDYVGKEWAFFWEYGNYIKDEKGIKHITSIRGAKPTASIQGSSYNAPDFDIKKNTAAFGPVFWFFCKPEKWQDPVSGAWLSSDKTETGSPITQLWGLSDSPWDTIDENHPMFNGVVYPGISDAKKADLLALGITADDFHLWPECKVWDADTSSWRIRPYWCHSAFNGGYYDSEYAIYSICNTPLRTNVSYRTINGFSGYAASGAVGGACVNGFGMLMDIIKNATKDSQAIHKGVSSASGTLVVANYAITEEENSRLKDTYGGYVFPVVDTYWFAVGRTVRLVNQTSGTDIGAFYVPGYNMQIGRIKALRTDLEFTTYDGTAVTGAKGLIIDPAENTVNPIQPFAVCTTAEDADAIIATDKYACCGACCIMAAGGETLNGGAAGTGVIGYHDGSIVSNTNGKYLYRVQGTEYMPGANNCAGDTVAVKGNGTEIPYNGSAITPDSTRYVILTCPQGTNRFNSTSNSPKTWTDAGYEVVGLSPTPVGNILNEQLSLQGVAHPVLVGGSGGTYDSLAYSGANPAEFLSFGDTARGAPAGSACLYLDGTLGDGRWNTAARD